MAEPRIIPAAFDHIEPIASRVRAADRAELWALCCSPPETVLKHGLTMSEFVYTGTIDDDPVCMFGVTPISHFGSTGRPWMVGTDRLDEHALIFLRRCRNVVDEMHHFFAVLENYVDVRNVKAIEWLRWLGFRFDSPAPQGPFNMPFMRFEKRR